MNCEICGKKIEGKGKKILIDGSILHVCTYCAALGDKEVRNNVVKYENRRLKFVPTKKTFEKNEDEMDIVQDFATLIKQAREKMGLSQDALAHKINEKVSVIKLIEAGRLKPNILLAKKIERALKINLFTRMEEY